MDIRTSPQKRPEPLMLIQSQQHPEILKWVWRTDTVMRFRQEETTGTLIQGQDCQVKQNESRLSNSVQCFTSDYWLYYFSSPYRPFSRCIQVNSDPQRCHVSEYWQHVVVGYCNTCLVVHKFSWDNSHRNQALSQRREEEGEKLWETKNLAIALEMREQRAQKVRLGVAVLIIVIVVFNVKLTSMTISEWT